MPDWRRMTALLLLDPQAALANNIPGPHTMLGFFALLIAIPLLTQFGGGQAILARLQSPSRLVRGLGVALKVLAVAAGILFIATAGYSQLVLLGALAFALYRGARLLAWTVNASRPPASRPAHLGEASRWRLATAGTVLILSAIVLTHMSFAFVWYYPDAARVSGDLMRLASAMRKAGEKNKGADGLPRYVLPTSDSDTGHYKLGQQLFYYLSPEEKARRWRFWHATEVRIAPDGKSFQAWAWPRVVPDWPWNHVMAIQSFYIDQTGQLRTTWVSEAGTRCPLDAPVYAVAKD